MWNFNCTTIKTKRQSNLGLLPKGGSHLLTLNFSNFKMSYLKKYLSYEHTVLGFQLLLTRSILNSRKIIAISNFNFKKNMTSSIMTSFRDKFYKQVFQNDWHVVLY